MTEHTIWGPMAIVLTHKQCVLRLYRKCLLHMLSWDIDRDLWRKDAVRLRYAFDINKNITDPRKAKAVLKKAEETFFKWQHPAPYIAPRSPGGTEWERNLPPPPHSLELLPQEREWLDEWIEYYTKHPQK